MKNKKDMSQAPLMFIKEMEEVLPQLEALYENDKALNAVPKDISMTGRPLSEIIGVSFS